MATTFVGRRYRCDLLGRCRLGRGFGDRRNFCDDGLGFGDGFRYGFGLDTATATDDRRSTLAHDPLFVDVFERSGRMPPNFSRTNAICLSSRAEVGPLSSMPRARTFSTNSPFSISSSAASLYALIFAIRCA